MNTYVVTLEICGMTGQVFWTPGFGYYTLDGRVPLRRKCSQTPGDNKEKGYSHDRDEPRS